MAQPQPATVPPQNLEAERSVLGAMLVSESAVSPVIDEVKLKAEDFYLDRHRAIFACLYDLYGKSSATDELSVIEALKGRGELEKAGDRHYVSELAASVAAVGNAGHHARIVQENSLLRRLLRAGQRIQESVRERDGDPRQLAEDAERLLFEGAHSEQAGDFRRVDEILHDEVDRLEKLSTGEAELIGTPSGVRAIDGITGGVQPRNPIRVAARPGLGKSPFATNRAESAAVETGQPVAFFSLQIS